MKNIILSLLAIISLSSFKPVIKGLAVVATIECSAQGYNNSSNSDGSYTIYKRNSPTNTYGNRIDILKINADSFIMRHSSIYFQNISLSGSPSAGNILWVDGTKLKASPMASVTIPVSQITGLKRQETYSGNTNSSGVLTVTFTTAYSSVPDIQAQVIPQTNPSQFIRVTAASTTGCTINVYQRNSVNLLGVDVLLSSTVNVNNAPVSILVTQK